MSLALRAAPMSTYTIPQALPAAASETVEAASALRSRIQGTSAQGANVTVAFGDPGREITEFAERQKADLIVIPSHGRTGLTRLLPGAVAERVAPSAHCPVLVLRK